jgi:hypothetical protein
MGYLINTLKKNPGSLGQYSNSPRKCHTIFFNINHYISAWTAAARAWLEFQSINYTTNYIFIRSFFFQIGGSLLQIVAKG